MRRLVLGAALLTAVGLCADQFPANVEDIEQDTLRVVVKGRGIFSIWGVKVPRENWMWGHVVKAALCQYLVKRGKVTCITQPAKVVNCGARFIQHGNDVGLLILKTGLGWHDPEAAPAGDPLHAVYGAAEQAARKNRVGLWSEPNLVTPTGEPMVTPSAMGPATQKAPGKKQVRKKRR